MTVIISLRFHLLHSVILTLTLTETDMNAQMVPAIPQQCSTSRHMAHKIL